MSEESIPNARIIIEFDAKRNSKWRKEGGSIPLSAIILGLKVAEYRFVEMADMGDVEVRGIKVEEATDLPEGCTRFVIDYSANGGAPSSRTFGIIPLSDIILAIECVKFHFVGELMMKAEAAKMQEMMRQGGGGIGRPGLILPPGTPMGNLRK